MSDLPTLCSPLLDQVAGVRHAFFTRKGGVSTGIYASLNVGRGSKDDEAAVAENRRRAAALFGVPAGALHTCYQIHSAKALIVEQSWGDARPQGDAVVTRSPGVVCGALAADCAPVLLADPEARVVAAAHAGWKGALGGIVEAAVGAMTSLGAEPARIVAAVGPCIGPESYEVGPDFRDAFEGHAPEATGFFRPGQAHDKWMFDLPAFVLDRLARAGITQSEWIGRDTCAEPDWFFSNRHAFHRAQPDYGRLLSAIALE